MGGGWGVAGKNRQVVFCGLPPCCIFSQGVLMPSVGLVGLAGNLLSVAVLSGQVGIIVIVNY